MELVSYPAWLLLYGLLFVLLATPTTGVIYCTFKVRVKVKKWRKALRSVGPLFRYNYSADYVLIFYAQDFRFLYGDDSSHPNAPIEVHLRKILLKRECFADIQKAATEILRPESSDVWYHLKPNHFQEASAALFDRHPGIAVPTQKTVYPVDRPSPYTHQNLRAAQEFFQGRQANTYLARLGARLK